MKIQSIPELRAAALLFFAMLACCLFAGSARAADDGPYLAVNDPDEFAWRLFAAVNQPARPDSEEAVWETWAEQSTVYADPCTVPTWPGIDPGFPAKRSSLVEILQSKLANRGVSADDFNAITGDENLQQVKLNRPFFNYVVEHGLWYQEGVIRRASTTGIDFPPEALVYKADWAEISEEEKPRYHWRLVSRKEYDEALDPGPGSSGSTAGSEDGESPTVLLGLVAFHLVSKVIDTWVWTTWNHAETLGRCDYIGCRDTFGSDPARIPPHREMGLPYDPGRLTPAAEALLEEAGLHQGWRHYRLMGTQNSFTDLTGRPTLLGNAVLEPGFGNSASCTTCHAMATLSATAESLDFLKSQQPFEGFVGTPDPDWYYPASPSAPATPLVYQTDFLWQLATETQSREGTACDPSS